MSERLLKEKKQKCFLLKKNGMQNTGFPQSLLLACCLCHNECFFSFFLSQFSAQKKFMKKASNFVFLDVSRGKRR